VVFVSSTIGECADERAAARRAIESLNFEPITFENIGARPHPARATYLEGLSRSQICVVIWKDSYGYIDPQSGLGISGIEDEFRRAREYGRDLFIYIKKSEARDPRLSALIEEAKSAHTLYFYDDVSQLEDQIRADITSEVSKTYTDRFFRDLAPPA
jgi:hypothetical protein